MFYASIKLIHFDIRDQFLTACILFYFQVNFDGAVKTFVITLSNPSCMSVCV